MVGRQEIVAFAAELSEIVRIVEVVIRRRHRFIYNRRKIAVIEIEVRSKEVVFARKPRFIIGLAEERLIGLLKRGRRCRVGVGVGNRNVTVEGRTMETAFKSKIEVGAFGWSRRSVGVRNRNVTVEGRTIETAMEFKTEIRLCGRLGRCVAVRYRNIAVKLRTLETAMEFKTEIGL